MSSEIIRLISNLCSFGTIVETKSANGLALAKVKIDDRVTDFFPVASKSNSFKKHYIPKIDEVSDIEKVLCCVNNEVKCKHNNIVYPDPPLYSEELNFLKTLGIKISTPLTTDLHPLYEKKYWNFNF